MSFAFKEELNELVIFRRCCSAANLWLLTLSRLSVIEGTDILHEPHGSNVGGLEPLRPHKVGATGRAPAGPVRGQGPPEAESFFAFAQPEELDNSS